MQNRFGLKDFVLLVVLAAVGLMVFLSMDQADRQWVKLTKLEAKLGDIERGVNSTPTPGGSQSAPAVPPGLESALSAMQSKLDAIEKRLGQTPAPAAVAPPAAGPAPAAGKETAAAAPKPDSAAGTPPASPATPGAARPVAAGGRDESWARPGIPIQWQPPYTPTTDPRAQPGFREGGEFTELFEANFPKIVPYIATDQYSRRIFELVVEPLADLDARTLNYRGVLAEAWQVDPQGLWVRVKIRPEARFSDGVPVTAEDVKYTFDDFIMNPQMETERYRSGLDKYKGMEIIRPDTVEIQFTEALFTNLDQLTTWILPKHFYSKFTPAQINQASGLVMGSGPYKLEIVDENNQWRQPAPCELVRNERYWGVKPPIAKMRFKAIDNEQARLVSYRNGEGDMVTPSAPQFKKLSSEPNWDRDNQSLNWVNMKSGNSFIAWQCGNRGTTGKPTPFADKRVRRAMTLMLDRQKMIDTIWAGLGQVSKGVANPASPAADPAQKPLPYDPEAAKALLAEAGWKDRDGNGVLEDEKGNEFVFEFTYSSGGEIAERIATFVKDACARVGIRCQPKPVDWAIIDSITKSRDFDALTMAWGANAPESDPRQIWHSDSIKNQGDNFIQWANPDADRLIDAGRRELDRDKRMEIWHRFERVVEADQPYTWVRIQPYLRFVNKSIGNVTMYPKSLEPREYFRLGGPSQPAPATGG